MCENVDMTRGISGRRDGFALIELITALFILTIGMFGVIQMYHFGLAKMQAMNESAVAIRAVRNEVETLRAIPFDKLQNVEAAPFRSETPAMAELVNVVPAVAIKDYDGRAKRLKEVTVAITWTGEHGRTIKKSVTTLVADKGGT